MPELPEVETTRTGIEPFLKGRRIHQIKVSNKNLRWPVPDALSLVGSLLVLAVVRRAKYIILETSDGAIIIHLGMSGSMRVVNHGAEAKKHDHVIFQLNDQKEIRFNDPRRFGCVLWSEDWRAHPLIKPLGPEPLSEDFTADYLYALAKRRSLAIKQLLMNSHIVVGVGNIYANEVLFLAGIDPRRAANKISLKRMALLVEQIKTVLSLAIAQGGTTLRDFVNSDGKPGYFQQQLFVYGRAGQPCKHCAEPLWEMKMNNRSTVFCSKCQK